MDVLIVHLGAGGAVDEGPEGADGRRAGDLQRGSPQLYKAKPPPTRLPQRRSLGHKARQRAPGPLAERPRGARRPRFKGGWRLSAALGRYRAFPSVFAVL